MREQISSGIIAYYKDNGTIWYLLLHYPGGHWGFPKGKIEEGENKLQTAARELTEETGLAVDEIIPGFEDHVEYFFRAEGHLYFKTVSFFLGEVKSKKIVLSSEHQNYEWLDYEQAYEKLTYQNSKDVLSRAHQFLNDFVKQEEE